MLTITDSAGAHLAKILDKAGLSGTDRLLAVRIYAAERGLAVLYDELRPDDVSFGYEGETVLVVEQRLAQLLDDSTLDIASDAHASTLVMR